MKRIIVYFLLTILSMSSSAENYLLNVGEEQTLIVPDVSWGVVDHTVWNCDNSNVVFVEKNNSGAKIKVTSYFEKAATVSLIYVSKYYDHKGFTRSYTGIKYYSVQCKGTAPTIVPSGINLKKDEKYQLHISPSSYESQAVWDASWNSPVASISSDGVVTAKKVGEDIIFATIPNLSDPLTCLVYVKDTKLTLSSNFASGTIERGTEVTLKASKSDVSIYYTLDGTTPEYYGEKYTEPIVINTNTILKAIAYDNEEKKEPCDILTRTYTTVDPQLKINSDVPSGIVSVGTKVKLISSDPNAIIYFTTDGSTPTIYSSIYQNPIIIDKNTTIKAFTVCDNYRNSDVLTLNYILKTVKMSVSPSDGTVSKGTQVSITPTPSDAVVFYTTDGSEPTALSNMYDGTPINIQKNTSLRAIAYAEGYAESSILSADYSVKLNLQASQASGTVDYMSEVTLTADDPEATIYYTTDGSTPTQESLVYSRPFIIDNTTTIKAIACHQDYLTSDVLTKNYIIQTVTLSVSPATSELLPAGTEITLTANPADAKIYYTTDGSEPTKASILYTTPIVAEHSFTIRAKAYYEGYKESNLIKNDYQVTSLIAESSTSDIGLRLNRHTIPSIKYNSTIKKGMNFGNIQFIKLKNGDAVPGEVIVVDSICYYIPDMELETGRYLLKVPQSAVMNKENENNLPSEYYMTIETCEYDPPMFYGNSSGQVFVIKSDKSLWGWGVCDDPSWCPIGDGTTNNYSIENPVKIMDNAKKMFMYNGQLVLKDDKSVWGWGNNNYYPLGINSNRKSVLKPTKVIDNVAKVATTYTHSLFVKEDNSCWACGLEIRGAVGNGSTSTFVPTPVKVLENVKDVAVEGLGENSCALKNDGTLWSWGRGYNRFSPIKDMEGVISIPGFCMAITKDNNSLWANIHHTSAIMDDVKRAYGDPERQFALKNDSTFWSWGIRECITTHSDGTPPDYYVDLGYYAEELIPYTPRKILDDVVSFTVSRYGDNAHVLAIKKDGSLWSWGINSLGQVGNGTFDTQITPIKVMEDVLCAFALPRESYAITGDGSVWHWGGGVTSPLKCDMEVFVDNVLLKSISIPSACIVEQNKKSYVPLDLGRTNADYESMEWTSSDEAIATVSSRGIVTGIAPGESTLTVKVTSKEGKEFSAYCNVTVTEGILKGDVNGDGVVNGTDIQAIINLIVEGEYEEMADINEDEQVNGTDIQEVINIIVNAE